MRRLVMLDVIAFEMHFPDSNIPVVYADGAAGVLSFLFGSSYEMTRLDVVVGYVIVVFCVFVMTFLLFNCAIAVGFQALASLKGVYERKSTIDMENWGNWQVCFALHAMTIASLWIAVQAWPIGCHHR
jgi:hypothetical protein